MAQAEEAKALQGHEDLLEHFGLTQAYDDYCKQQLPEGLETFLRGLPQALTETPEETEDAKAEVQLLHSSNRTGHTCSLSGALVAMQGGLSSRTRVC